MVDGYGRGHLEEWAGGKRNANIFTRENWQRLQHALEHLASSVPHHSLGIVLDDSSPRVFRLLEVRSGSSAVGITCKLEQVDGRKKEYVNQVPKATGDACNT